MSRNGLWPAAILAVNSTDDLVLSGLRAALVRGLGRFWKQVRDHWKERPRLVDLCAGYIDEAPATMRFG